MLENMLSQFLAESQAKDLYLSVKKIWLQWATTISWLKSSTETCNQWKPLEVNVPGQEGHNIIQHKTTGFISGIYYFF